MSNGHGMLRRTNIRMFKLVLGGAWGVGKTSIRKRYLGQGFQGEYIRTLGADFALKTSEMIINGRKVVIQWQIWDLAGQPAFDVIRRVYIQGARAALVVYDVTRPSTLGEAGMWCNEIWNYCGERRRRIPIILVGNKIDLRTEEREDLMVNSQKGKELADSLGIPFIETSAKTGENIKKAFKLLGDIVIREYS